MKAGFHFNYNHKTLQKGNYAYVLYQVVLNIILTNDKINISTKIFTGDLLLDVLANDRVEMENGHALFFNKEKYFQVINEWSTAEESNLLTIDNDGMTSIINGEVFVICFESVDKKTALLLDSLFKKEIPSYLGVLEVDETSFVHWTVYSNTIGPRLRLIGKKIYVFWDGICEDSKDYGLFHFLQNEILAQNVDFEGLNGQHTIFDKYHNYKHAKRIKTLKNDIGDYLAFIADDVISKLTDPCPEIGNKLWAAFNTFSNAELDEEYSQVCITCRRIIEYVSDKLFPPTDAVINGHNLGEQQYRNRLLAYADIEKRSDTDIQVISINAKNLSEQIEKIENLINKGIHNDLYRNECRRCLVHTIMLLDDICSLKNVPFEINDDSIILPCLPPAKYQKAILIFPCPSYQAEKGGFIPAIFYFFIGGSLPLASKPAAFPLPPLRGHPATPPKKLDGNLPTRFFILSF